MFGVRTTAGEFSWEAFKEKSEIEQVKALSKTCTGCQNTGGHLKDRKSRKKLLKSD